MVAELVKEGAQLAARAMMGARLFRAERHDRIANQKVCLLETPLAVRAERRRISDWRRQPFLSFARKRDAKPFYDRLLKTGDWTKVEEFTPEQVKAVWEIARETESYQKFTELMNRK